MKKKLQHAHDLVVRVYLCVVCRERHEKTFAKNHLPPIAQTEYCGHCQSDRFFRLMEGS